MKNPARDTRQMSNQLIISTRVLKMRVINNNNNNNNNNNDKNNNNHFI